MTNAAKKDHTASAARRQRLKDWETSNSRGRIQVTDKTPLEVYYQMADRLLQAFHQALDERRLDDAYIFGVRFATFSLEQLPQHCQYKANGHKRQRLQNARNVDNVVQKLESVACRMDAEELLLEHQRHQEALALKQKQAEVEAQQQQKEKANKSKKQDYQAILQQQRAEFQAQKQAEKRAKAEQQRQKMEQSAMEKLKKLNMQPPDQAPVKHTATTVPKPTTKKIPSNSKLTGANTGTTNKKSLEMASVFDGSHAEEKKTETPAAEPPAPTKPKKKLFGLSPKKSSRKSQQQQQQQQQQSKPAEQRDSLAVSQSVRQIAEPTPELQPVQLIPNAAPQPSKGKPSMTSQKSSSAKQMSAKPVSKPATAQSSTPALTEAQTQQAMKEAQEFRKKLMLPSKNKKSSSKRIATEKKPSETYLDAVQPTPHKSISSKKEWWVPDTGTSNTETAVDATKNESQTKLEPEGLQNTVAASEADDATNHQEPTEPLSQKQDSQRAWWVPNVGAAVSAMSDTVAGYTRNSRYEGHEVLAAGTPMPTEEDEPESPPSSAANNPKFTKSEARTIRLLEDTIKLQERRLEQMEASNQPTLWRQEAKRRVKQGDRPGALKCLAKKKRFLQQLDVTKHAIFNMETQLIMLESAVENRQVSSIMEEAKTVMGQLQGGAPVDLNITNEQLAQVLSAVGQDDADYDEDELWSELNEDERDETNSVSLGDESISSLLPDVPGSLLELPTPEPQEQRHATLL